MKKWFHMAAGALAAAVLCAAGTMVSWAGTVQVQAQLSSCSITADKGAIEVKGTSSGSTAGTDGNIYLFELEPFETDLAGRTDYLGVAPAGGEFSLAFETGWGSSPDRAYNRYAAAVYDGTGYTIVSEPRYVSNPEVLAPNQEEFYTPLTKKGLRVNLDQLADAMELGVKHAGVDILFQQIMGEGIEFEYDGKVYHFNGPVIADYDKMISSLSNKGISVTAVILNGWSDATTHLVYPGVQKNDQAFYYMFNTAEQAGYEETRAIAAFLAQRYDGSDPNHGKVSNWVIGNEVNNQLNWNYMASTDLTSYVKAYHNAFRVFYTAIKTASASDRVYFSLDYNWNKDADGKNKFGGKEFTDSFNSISASQGPMDWGLAYHPYPYPSTEPEFWLAPEGAVTSDFNSPVINFKNINTLTDYFCQEAFKKPDGSVRHIILTEQGFSAKSATRGDVPYEQAAAFAYAYYLVDSNPYIEAFLLSRQIDAPSEVNTGLALGLWECDMSQPDKMIPTMRRKIWEVFKNIDKTKYTLETTEFAKKIIGIERWQDIIPNFKWKGLENKQDK